MRENPSFIDKSISVDRTEQLKTFPLPKTKMEDYMSFQLLKQELEIAYRSSNLSQLNSVKARIIKFSIGRIFLEDRYMFNTIDEMSNFLTQRGYRQEDIESTAEHEQAHFQKALELGYTPRVQVWLLNFWNRDSTFAPAVIVNGVVSPEHSAAIAAAPSSLSKDDLEKLERYPDAKETLLKQGIASRMKNFFK